MVYAYNYLYLLDDILVSIDYYVERYLVAGETCQPTLGIMNMFSEIKLTTPTKLKSCKPRIGTDLTLAQNWIPLLKLVRLFGNAPIQIKSADIQRVLVFPTVSLKVFEFKKRWCSSGSISILVFALIRAFSTYAQYQTTVLPTWSYSAPTNSSAVSQKITQTEELIQSFSLYAVPIINWFEWISLLVCFPDFVKFLNNWQIFGEKFCHWNSAGLEVSGLVWIVLRTFGLTVGILLLRIAYMFTTTGYDSIAIWFTILLGFVNEAVAFIEDLKVICMLQSVATGFGKVTEICTTYAV